MTKCQKEHVHSSKKGQDGNAGPKIHKVSTGHAYIYGRIKNIQTGYNRITKMMIDQGNLLGAGVGISKAFLDKMN